jgi:hypothetical protein
MRRLIATILTMATVTTAAAEPKSIIEHVGLDRVMVGVVGGGQR